VIGIMGVIAVFVGGSLQAVVNGNSLDRALIGITAAMENARQYSIAKGTYTWVGLNSSKNSETGLSTITVAIFASHDGTRGEGALPLQVVSKTEKFELVELSDQIPAENRLYSSGQIPYQDRAIYANAATFQPTSEQLPPKLRDMSFDWSVIFTPEGVACIDDAAPATGTLGATGSGLSPEEAICMMISSCKGNRVTATEKCAASMIRINGVTGHVEVFQPQP